MSFSLREFQPEDVSGINKVALDAFYELRHHYSDWPTFRVTSATWHH